ncbi:hypothetical protein DL765_003818 [Monosporascus sp. GIB2]|nr:hypothetical protein DL765_003818 [Monosporascus sp. GIB2]
MAKGWALDMRALKARSLRRPPAGEASRIRGGVSTNQGIRRSEQDPKTWSFGVGGGPVIGAEPEDLSHISGNDVQIVPPSTACDRTGNLGSTGNRNLSVNIEPRDRSPYHHHSSENMPVLAGGYATDAAAQLQGGFRRPTEVEGSTFPSGNGQHVWSADAIGISTQCQPFETLAAVAMNNAPAQWFHSDANHIAAQANSGEFGAGFHGAIGILDFDAFGFTPYLPSLSTD